MSEHQNCPKIPHTGSGYMHAEDDDGPFMDDGILYCGRCHGYISVWRQRDAQPPTPAPNFIQAATVDIASLRRELAEAKEEIARQAKLLEKYRGMDGTILRLYSNPDEVGWRGWIEAEPHDAEGKEPGEILGYVNRSGHIAWQWMLPPGFVPPGREERET
jgi:hypothetical protein